MMITTITNLIQPGQWANFETNLRDPAHQEEDIVKSPVFILTREGIGDNLKAMVLDQNLNLLVWYADNKTRFKNGTICGRCASGSFWAGVLEISVANIKLTVQTPSILKEAKERRAKFLKNYPQMESQFFKISEETSVKEIDSRFICPITLEPFKDPVTAPDGITYERQAIVNWINAYGNSPFTREPLTEKQLITNFALRPNDNKKI